MNSFTDPRLHAARVLCRVDEGGAHAARLLADALPATRELVLGILRWQRTLDNLLATHSRRPLAGLETAVRATLRIGLYEALRMRTPAPVAVSEAVRLAKVLAPHASGLINAVLRRAVADPWPSADDERVAIGLRLSHPDWIVDRWRTLLGSALLERALVAGQTPAPLSLLAGTAQLARLAGAGVLYEPHPYVPGVVRVTGGASKAVLAVQEGSVYAMDGSAVIVARLLPPTPGLVVDLAAAPGGKSMVLALECASPQRLACDRSLSRVVLMRSNFQAISAAPWMVVSDGVLPPLRPASCAAVILDAPCSGTGTLRRHPEIRWRLQREDLPRLATTQRRLIAAAARLVRPGGYLLYATCSIEPEENAEVVAGIDFEGVDLAERLPSGVIWVGLPSLGVVIPPSVDGDGFTVHLLRRPA